MSLPDLPQVPVLFTVSNFVPTMTTNPPSYCTAVVSLPEPPKNGEVTLSGTAPNQVLTVKKGVKMQMTLASTVSGSTFYPVGLVIKQVGGNSDPTGRNAFPAQLVNTTRNDGVSVTTLTLWDVIPQVTNFDFLLAIESNIGQLGVIDPLISNAS